MPNPLASFTNSPLDGLGFSSATSFSAPQNTNAGTTFNFNSAGASGGLESANATASASATAASTGKSLPYVDANPNQRTNQIPLLTLPDGGTVQIVLEAIAVGALLWYAWKTINP